jgi:hypothetical protein
MWETSSVARSSNIMLAVLAMSGLCFVNRIAQETINSVPSSDLLRLRCIWGIEWRLDGLRDLRYSAGSSDGLVQTPDGDCFFAEGEGGFKR